LFKKTFFIMFSFFVLFSTIGSTSLVVYAEDTMAITSDKYGTQYKGKVTFDQKTCTEEYTKFNAKVADVKQKDYKYEDDDVSGMMGKITEMLNSLAIWLGNVFSNLIFGSACYLGFAPSQLLQVMFFPVVLDNFLFLGTLSSAVRTISILVLGVVTVLAIYELNRKEGTIGEEIVSKIGKFLVAGGLIAFSGFILQGIFDIANILGYYVSNYTVDINVDQGGKIGKVGVNLLNFPTVFITYLEFAFSPDVLNKIPTFSLGILGVMTIIKIIVMIFMVKDLLQVAIYGLKRLITLVASAILLPILAGLIPSYKTQDIFNKYFRSVIAAAFTPVLFGVIYLASAPFVIDDMVNMIDAPLLKVIVIAFYLNILVSLPGYVDNLVGESNSIGSPNFEKRVKHMSGGNFLKSEFQGVNKMARAVGRENTQHRVNGDSRYTGSATKLAARTAGGYTKRKVQKAVWGKKM